MNLTGCPQLSSMMVLVVHMLLTLVAVGGIVVGLSVGGDVVSVLVRGKVVGDV